MSEQGFKKFLKSLSYEQLSNVVWHRLVDYSTPGFINPSMGRDDYYASCILHSLYGSKGETSLAVKVKKICGEHIRKIAEIPTEKMFDGKSIAPEIIAIHEFSFLSAAIYSASAIEPLTILYGRDFSILPRKLQADTLGYIAQGLAQILMWHRYLATDRQRVILELEMWKNDTVHSYDVSYFRDLVWIFPNLRQELIEKLRFNSLTVDEEKLDRSISRINPKLFKPIVNPVELKELGFSENEVQVALQQEQRWLQEQTIHPMKV